MNFFFKVTMFSVLSVLFFSCGNKTKVNSLTEASFQGEWNIIEVDGEKLDMKTIPFIGFDLNRKQVYGNGGCNRFVGDLNMDSIQYNKVFISNVASTKATCPYSKIENIILDDLENVVFVKTVSDVPEELELFSRDSIKLFVLEKRKEQESLLSELSGEWVIESAYGNKIMGTAEVAPFIGIDTDESRIYGNVGCNTINGVLEQESGKANSLHFKNIATTQMLCASMETEKIVLECLNATKSFKMTADGKIALYNAAGDELMILKKE